MSGPRGPDALVHALRRGVFDAGRASSLVDEADLVTPCVRLTPLAVLEG